MSKYKYDLQEYQTAEGKVPFRLWLKALRDSRVQARLLSRVIRAGFGHLGDWKPLKGTDGLCEMRDHSGPGYRIYFKIYRQTILVVYAGSDKDTQDKIIRQAVDYLADYETRMKDET